MPKPGAPNFRVNSECFAQLLRIRSKTPNFGVTKNSVGVLILAIFLLFLPRTPVLVSLTPWLVFLVEISPVSSVVVPAASLSSLVVVLAAAVSSLMVVPATLSSPVVVPAALSVRLTNSPEGPDSELNSERGLGLLPLEKQVLALCTQLTRDT